MAMPKNRKRRRCMECGGKLLHVTNAEVRRSIWVGRDARVYWLGRPRLVEIDDEVHLICDDCGNEEE
jgi:RNase P subunit RPR2